MFHILQLLLLLIAAVEAIKVLKQMMFQLLNQYKILKRLMDSKLIYLVQTDTTVGFSSSSDEKLSSKTKTS